MPADALLTTAEVASKLRAPESTVRYWRLISYGPPSIKVGRRVLYPETQVEAWLAQLAMEPGSASRHSPQPAA